MSRLIIAWLAATLLLTAGCGSGDGEKPAGDPAFQTYTADPAEEPADAPEEAETPPT